MKRVIVYVALVGLDGVAAVEAGREFLLSYAWTGGIIFFAGSSTKFIA
jgi:hypothetical protein